MWHEGIIFKLKQNGISGKLLYGLSNYLKDRKQKVTLNGQVSSWIGVNVGVPQRSILGPLLLLAYINDLADGLSSNAKLFVNDTSLFSVIHDVDTSANELYNDLCQINKWAFQWKMSYNLDSSKLLLAEKLKKFLIVRYVLIVALSRNHQIKNTSHISWCSINLWITFKSNNYQGKQNYRTDTGIAKCFAPTGIKD